MKTIVKKKNIGVLGSTGRMGKLLVEVLARSENFQYGSGYSRHENYKNLNTVFMSSDCVIDFSTAEILAEVLQLAKQYCKPVVICTTGWQLVDKADLLAEVSQVIPIMIAANTSLGAWLHRSLARHAARVLDAQYDLDLLERHHRLKKDSPSGTAQQLLADLRVERPTGEIGVHVYRVGNIVGEHEVSFTSNEERITITHEVFDRKIFAIGALRLAHWLLLDERKPGLYTIDDLYA